MADLIGSSVPRSYWVIAGLSLVMASESPTTHMRPFARSPLPPTPFPPGFPSGFPEPDEHAVITRTANPRVKETEAFISSLLDDRAKPDRTVSEGITIKVHKNAKVAEPEVRDPPPKGLRRRTGSSPRR